MSEIEIARFIKSDPFIRVYPLLKFSPYSTAPTLEVQRILVQLKCLALLMLTALLEFTLY